MRSRLLVGVIGAGMEETDETGNDNVATAEVPLDVPDANVTSSLYPCGIHLQ